MGYFNWVCLWWIYQLIARTFRYACQKCTTSWRTFWYGSINWLCFCSSLSNYELNQTINQLKLDQLLQKHNQLIEPYQKVLQLVVHFWHAYLKVRAIS